MPKHKYAPGALVFAKVKGYPPWPARITGLGSKDRYKIYFYGTYEIATLKSEDIWLYTPETKEKFAPKNMKRKGYTEGIDQIENTPEIAPVEGEYDDPGMLNNTQDSQESLAIDEVPKNKSKAATQKLTEVVKKPVVTPKSVTKPMKRKADDIADGETPAKRTAGEVSGDENNQGEEKFSRSGRAIKPKKFGDDLIGSPKPDTEVGDRSTKSSKSPRKELIAQVSPTKSDSEPRKMWVKVKNTDDLIEINLDKDRPDSFESNEAKIEWEMASARKALKFKKRVESGEFIPPEIKKKLEEKEKLSAEDRAVLDREKQLEKRKSKLRWLKIEQKLVDLDIAVKTALHLERPAPDRCITALDELNELAVAPLMLKKQPDIVTTIRRLRKYIGPQSYCNWPDKEARDKMERAVLTIQTKADQIYNKFKSFFAYQEGDRTFWEMFEAEVNEFKNKTAGMDESKILSLIRDPTKPLSNLNPLSDDEEL
eukprot:TRINITY_DN45713_c0_g1_i1.p1 TRINITY_DN45713_c0_g1~~TRINITY_DN45713_c0_g1_i1.p1  ORF type:complete len:482 (-),score=200.38 TRINITY_DN45713_c0_g1_i1:278-1723(-)